MIHSSKQNAGFTAVELLVTLFVAAAFLIAGYQLFSIVIKDGGEARAQSRVSNVAYQYVRQYADSATNPCSTVNPLTSQPITIDGVVDATITVVITCAQSDARSLSKIDVTISYGRPQKALSYSTYTDRSTGANTSVDVVEGLVAQWKLNGNAQSSVGNANGTIYGNALPTSNRNSVGNSAYSFTAATPGQYIGVNNTLGLGNTNVTISLWVNNPTATNSGQFVKVGSSPRGYGIGIGGANYDNNTPGTRIVALFEGVRWITTTTNLDTGWHHLALTIDATGVPRVYKDGTLIGTYTGAVAAAPAASDTIWIGGQGGRWTTGSLDDIRIYNRALSESEIGAIHGPRNPQ